MLLDTTTDMMQRATSSDSNLLELYMRLETSINDILYELFSNYYTLINLLMGVSLSAPILDDYREFSRARILNHLKAMSLDGKDMTKMENKTNHGRSNFASTGKVTPRKIPTN